jgi:hypothetical protein
LGKSLRPLLIDPARRWKDVPNRYAGRISFNVTVNRRLRFPANAMPSSSALSALQLPEKPIPTSQPPNSRSATQVSQSPVIVRGA